MGPITTVTLKRNFYEVCSGRRYLVYRKGARLTGRLMKQGGYLRVVPPGRFAGSRHYVPPSHW